MTALRHDGKGELRRGIAGISALFAPVFAFSAAVNLLMLTGPIFMLQIYDRVLGSGSEATLVALSAIVIFLYLMMGVLDHLRGRVAARAGARLQHDLERRVFDASLRRMAVEPGDPVSLSAQRDLEAVQRLLASPVFLAIFDMPWTPVFLLGIFLFHPLLGWFALAGGAVLIVITIINQRRTRRPVEAANSAIARAERTAGMLKDEAEVIRALGMQSAGFDRWQRERGAALAESIASSDAASIFSTLSKTFRLFLQSAMLGLGAWLVLRGELGPGAMIAASIVLGRALAPVEQAVSQWSTVQRAQEGWRNLGRLLGMVPPERPRTPLPRPAARLEVANLVVVPPGTNDAVLRGVTFQLNPGQALGVIGPSGSGKSSLGRAVIGAWPVAGGSIRLDGATLEQYAPEELGRLVGYLPQRVTVFDGTIAENIARLDPDPDPAELVRAAERAQAHDMVKRLSDEGYNARLTAHGSRLSGGQMQRIGLARALYGDPVIVVLDEPNSNLDNDGSLALNTAIRDLKAAGAAVMVMAHRPAAIQECDLLLVLEAGRQVAFGPRDQVLRQVVRNHTDLVRAAPGEPA